MFWIAIALAAAAAASGAKAGKERKISANFQQRVAQNRSVRARNQARKEFRAARAAVLTGAVNSGADILSSGNQGIQNSLKSQIQENIQFSLQEEDLGRQANKAAEDAAKFGFLAQALGQGASIAAGGMGQAKAASTTQATPAISNTNLNPSPFIFTGNK